MIDRLIETGRCCEMEMHVDKTQAIKISRKPFPLQTLIYKKQLRMWSIATIWVA
jgi:hypothetical protein